VLLRRFNNIINIRLVFIIFLIAFSNSACKKQTKYDEDPKRTSKSPKQRLFGNWSLSEYTFNGDNILPNLNALFSNRFDVLGLTLTYSFHDSEVNDALGIHCNPFFSAEEQKFDGSNMTLNQKSFARPVPAADSLFKEWLITPFHFTNQSEASWRVTKLFDNSLNIVLETDTGDFKMFFTKM